MKQNHFVNHSVRAILIGVTDYSAIPDTPDLPPGENDVRLMEAALVNGLKVSPFYVWVKGKQPGTVTVEDFLNGIKRLLSDADEDCTVILYFSGHGMQLPEGHALLFSDGPVLTQSVIDLLEELRPKKRILFLDCCMSGAHTLRTPKKLGTKAWIRELLLEGTAVFSSARGYEKAGYADQVPASLFTVFLFGAMSGYLGVKDGKLSLDTIRELVFSQARIWNEEHPERRQHPVFRSSLGGDVYFPVETGETYPDKEFALDLKDYAIVSVRPLHSQTAKRYAVKAFLKRKMKENELCACNHEIVRLVQPLEIFSSKRDEERWKGKPVDLVFTYFGYSREDLVYGNHAYYTTWARTAPGRKKWYQEGRNARITDGILIHVNSGYSLSHRLTEKNKADAPTVLKQTRRLMRRILDLGEAVLTEWQEMRNGTVGEEECKCNLQPALNEINRIYLTLTDLPVPPAELVHWSLLAGNVAGDVQDFSLLLSDRSREAPGKISEDWTRMEKAVARFHEDLDILLEEEKTLQLS